LPDENIFGATEDTVPELLFSPVAHAGYYLFLSPLSVGTHTIAWKATGACGTQDISYTIQVVPRGRY
jgi:hypothetical protein